MSPSLILCFVLMQPDSIDMICNKAVEVVMELDCPELLEEAKAIQGKYSKLFKLFSICHFEYNRSQPMDDQSIAALGITIFTIMLCTHNS